MSPAEPRLSVVIPARDAERFLGPTVRSLIDQTIERLEIIIVDDGSRDGTRALADALAAQYEGNGRAFRLIALEGCGPAAARNAGVAVAKAPFIGFLDADDLWAPDKAALHVDLMENDPDIDLSFSWFRFVDENGVDLMCPYRPAVDRLGYLDLLPKNLIHTSTVVARRKAILAAGGFDATLPTYEDFDLWLRIAHRRWRQAAGATTGAANLACIGKVLTDYRRHATQITRDWRVMHDGWLRVFEANQRLEPLAARAIEPQARGAHFEYCSSLAFEAGDHARARSLMLAAWRVGGPRLAGKPSAWWMSTVCVFTLLPRRFQPTVRMMIQGLRRIFASSTSLTTALRMRMIPRASRARAAACSVPEPAAPTVADVPVAFAKRS